MSLYTPFFRVTKTDTGAKIVHNCDGGLNFAANDNVDEDTYRLILRAIEEGKRQKADEIKKALGVR